jgi:hypothetical protein
VALGRSLIVVPLLLAGCGSHERVVEWREGLLPLAGGPPRALVPSLPKGARFCGGRSLQFVATSAQGVNSALDLHWFKVRNQGQRTCALRGRPVVTVVSAGGQPVSIAQIPGTYGEVTFAERTFGLRPGHSASLGLFVGNACRDTSRRKTGALIVLETGDRRVRVPLTTCAPGLNMSLTPFQPTDRLPPVRFTQLPFRASIVGHPHARRGTTLVYRVRLRNVAARPFRFPWCPIVNERTGHPKGQFFGLNCRPAGTIAPGESILFVIHYKLSRHYRPGNRTLHRTVLNPLNDVQVGTKTTLRIDP